MMNTCDDMVLELDSAPIDPRTGNRVIYAANFIADRNSMIGHRNEDWVRREINWFRGGSNNLDDMETPVPTAFQGCAGSDHSVNSAYGHILFGRGEELPLGLPLFDRILNTLVVEGKHTRHAVAIISDRDIHNLAHKRGRNDFICTNALNIMIDDSNRVHIIAQMRSMDAVWGYRADYSMWDFLMEEILEQLSIIMPELIRGNIIFQVANLHVYPRHFELLAKEAELADDRLNTLLRRQWMDKSMRIKVENKENVSVGEMSA